LIDWKEEKAKKDMMNICVVTQQLKNVYSGIGLYAKNLVNQLYKMDCNLTVVVPKSQKPDIRVGYHIVEIDDEKFLKSQARWIELSWNFAKEIRELEKVQNFDLIHFTDFRDSFLCKTIAPKIGNINDTYSAELHPLRYYSENYFDWVTRWLYYRLMYFIEKIKVPNLEFVIANSKYTYEKICNSYNIPAEKIRMCYKGIDLRHYNKEFDSKPHGTKSNGIRILFVGGNMQRKGLADLIKAASLVVRAYPEAKFLIIGMDKQIPKFKSLCENYNVLKNFHFLGWISQEKIIEYYKSSSIFVMPSLTEALGVVFLEAMACGIPVIGTRAGGIPEIIKDKETGLLVPVNSATHLANAILELIVKPKLRDELIRNGFEQVKKFSIENVMQCTNNIYSIFYKEKCD
jgi:glycosyltransferase involved in cell wall biosynthesis